MQARNCSFRKHSACFKCFGDAGAFLHHHGNCYGLDLMLHIFISARLGGHLDDVDILTRTAVQSLEHSAEYLDCRLVEKRADHRYFPDKSIPYESTSIRGEK